MKALLEKHRMLMWLIATLLIEVMLGVFIYFSETNSVFSQFLMLPVRILWYRALVKESGLAKTLYWRIFYLAIAIFLVGALFRLEHWPYGRLILMLSMLLFVITYAIRFIKKQRKRILDVLKLLFIVSNLIFAWLKFQHYIGKENPLSFIYLLLFYSIIFIFAVEQDKERRKDGHFSFE